MKLIRAHFQSLSEAQLEEMQVMIADILRQRRTANIRKDIPSDPFRLVPLRGEKP